MNGGSTFIYEILSLLTTCNHFSIFYCSNHLQPYPTFYIMKNLLHDTEAFLMVLLFIFAMFSVGILPYFYNLQQNNAFQQNLNTVIECRKSVEITQMDKICGPIPQRGNTK